MTSVEQAVTGKDASLNEQREIVASLGGVLCNCAVAMPIAPAGMCPNCGVEGPFYKQALAHYAATHNGSDPHENDRIVSRYKKLDLHAAFKEEPEDIEWLKEDFLESGTLSCLFSKPGVGKSLISLEIAIEVVKTGGSVVYLDDENRAADIVDRLRSFGCTPDELAERLFIYNFQNLPPLDTEAGGDHLDALVGEDKPDLVILDTISRMIKGSENDADTYIQLYRCQPDPAEGTQGSGPAPRPRGQGLRARSAGQLGEGVGRGRALAPDPGRGVHVHPGVREVQVRSHPLRHADQPQAPVRTAAPHLGRAH